LSGVNTARPVNKGIMKKYNIIYADPPWRFKVWCRDTGLGRSADAHYRTMTLDEIKAYPVAAANDCALFLWATRPMICEALEVMDAWGFEYKTEAFTWVKTTKTGKWHFGMGYWTRANTEPVLLGVRGNIHRVARNVPQLLVAPVREHSRKPDEIRERIVRLMGDLPRIELFARERHEGWDAEGDELVG